MILVHLESACLSFQREKGLEREVGSLRKGRAGQREERFSRSILGCWGFLVEKGRRRMAVS